MGTTEQDLRQRITAGSQDLEDYRDLAHLLISSNRSEEAAVVYRQGLRLSLTKLDRAEILMELAWILYDPLGEEGEARTLAEKAIDVLTDESQGRKASVIRGSSYGLLAHCLWRTDEDAGIRAARSGLAELERVIAESLDPAQIADACADAARLQNLLGDPEMAIALCRKALEYALPDLNRLYGLLALNDALLRANRPGEAEQVLDEAFQYLEADKGALPRLYFQRGLVMRSTNRIAEATESFVRVIQALNTHPTLSNDPVMLTAVHTNLGEIYYELKQYGEAANAFEKALLHLSDDSEDRCFALLWLGQCYRGKGEYGRARDCYEEVLALASASDENREAARKSLAALPPLPERRIH